MSVQTPQIRHMHADEMRETAVREYGSIDNWREHYLDAVGKEKVQRQYEKIIEWYGGKDAYLGAVKKPLKNKREKCLGNFKT